MHVSVCSKTSTFLLLSLSLSLSLSSPFIHGSILSQNPKLNKFVAMDLLVGICWVNVGHATSLMLLSMVVSLCIRSGDVFEFWWKQSWAHGFREWWVQGWQARQVQAMMGLGASNMWWLGGSAGYQEFWFVAFVIYLFF